jgi:hypothetical protein
VPADGSARVRAGLIGSVPPTAFFVQPDRGKQWLTRIPKDPSAYEAVRKLKLGSFRHGELRAKLPLDAELFARNDLEADVLNWARERFREIVESGLLDHPPPKGKAPASEEDEEAAED